ncbi:protein phosphatase inhibitor [Onchocerca flexuosa]|uniref:E3 ubiquitin-protein ligase PPP1R11 n=1 Tax=Onchocerca flexuosa TaxID=387005 RepID=A0A238BLX2_9BILA|nr:protein phosphatase inhibitor [Onchocerca flexuosa]
MSNEAIALGSLATIIEEQRVERTHQAPLILRLTKPEVERPHVTWAKDTIDNEHLGKLKSNCCCIWVKPHIWDDPTTWEQDEYEVEHCRGHTLPMRTK